MKVNGKTLALLGLAGGGLYVAVGQGSGSTGSGGGSSGDQQGGQQPTGPPEPDAEADPEGETPTLGEVADEAENYFEENPDSVLHWDDPDGGEHTFVGEDSTSPETSDNVAGISDEYFEDWDAVEEEDSSSTDDSTNSWVDDAMDNPDQNYL